VSNRLLLWSCFGLAQLCSCLATLGQYAAYARDAVFTAGWDTLLGVFEISSVALIWLVFFPPAFYRSWIGDAAATTDAAAGPRVSSARNRPPNWRGLRRTRRR